MDAGFPGQLSAKGLIQALAQHMGSRKPMPVTVARSDGTRATLHVMATDAMQAKR